MRSRIACGVILTRERVHSVSGKYSPVCLYVNTRMVTNFDSLLEIVYKVLRWQRSCSNLSNKWMVDILEVDVQT